MEKIILALLTLFIFVSCSKDAELVRKEKPKIEEMEALLAQDEILIVSEDLKPVVDAVVFIEGYSSDLLITNQDGVIILPRLFDEKVNLSILAEGHNGTTYLKTSPSKKVYIIKAQSERVEVKGNAVNYGDLKRDGFIDFGLILPLAAKADFFNFNMEMFLSPEVDTIRVIGREVNIPSNISLPKQSERYLFFTINLDKPSYRSFLPPNGEHELVALHGKFPLKKVADDAQSDKPFSDLINHFSFLQFGIQELNVLGPINGANIAVNEFPMDMNVRIQTADNIPKDFSYMAAILNEKSGKYFATDIKKLAAKSHADLRRKDLVGIAYAAGIIAQERREGDTTVIEPAMSISMLPAVNGIKLPHLDLVAAPQIANDKVLLSKPTANFAFALGTHLALKEYPTNSSQGKVLWDIYADEWVEEVLVPTSLLQLEFTNTLSWEVNFLGSSNESEKPVGPRMYDVADFISRNATDL